jgi:ubiquinone biosynthesis protein COQ9
LQVLGYLSARSDRRTVEEMENAGVGALKMRDRIKLAIRLRVERHGGDREAVRRAMGSLSLPLNGPLAAKLLYATVDALWYAAGDTSTDFSFYTRRLTLAGVYSSTLLYWLSDHSPGSEATWRFLERRIDDVMKLERAKSRVRSWTGVRPGMPSRR